MRCPCQACPPRARPSLAAGVQVGVDLATDGTTGAGVGPGAATHQNEPMQAYRILPQHRTWTTIAYTRNKEEAPRPQGVRRPGRRGCLGAQNGLGETGGFSRTDLRAAASWSHQTLSRHRVSLHTLQMMYVKRWNASWVILPGPSPGSTGVTGPQRPVFGQRPPCTNHPKEPMQPSKTLPQHRTPTK
jgi:hypothetical protein